MIVPGQDFTIEDMSAWVNELDEPTLEKITTFFANIPKLYLKIKVKCPKCGREEVFEFTELEDFFL
jgi:adenine-specific DNA methylase